MTDFALESLYSTLHKIDTCCISSPAHRGFAPPQPSTLCCIALAAYSTEQYEPPSYIHVGWRSACIAQIHPVQHIKCHREAPISRSMSIPNIANATKEHRILNSTILSSVKCDATEACTLYSSLICRWGISQGMSVTRIHCQKTGMTECLAQLQCSLPPSVTMDTDEECLLLILPKAAYVQVLQHCGLFLVLCEELAGLQRLIVHTTAIFCHHLTFHPVEGKGNHTSHFRTSLHCNVTTCYNLFEIHTKFI